MAQTRADLATRTLHFLGILAAGENASAADQVLAEEKVQSVHDDLYQRSLSRWPVSEVPDACAEGYAMMAAQLLAPNFGLQVAADLWAKGEGMVVRSSGARHDAYRPTEAEYY